MGIGLYRTTFSSFCLCCGEAVNLPQDTSVRVRFFYPILRFERRKPKKRNEEASLLILLGYVVVTLQELEQELLVQVPASALP